MASTKVAVESSSETASSETTSEKPKVFISYSWTSVAHRERVRHWAEQLLADGVDVVLDVFDLKHGQDKYAFMERMVTDPSVTHVLVVSDKEYAEKADKREAGVGTESQIISKEVYDKANQSKFIPVVCAFADDEEPCLPTFLKSRIWIDFSSDEAANDNWEQLVRVLYGKPQHEKPNIGKAPGYLLASKDSPADPAISRFNALRQAIMQGKRGVPLYRRDFLEACIKYADALRVRQQPDDGTLGERVLADCGRLRPVRNHVVNWVLLENEAGPSQEFADTLIPFLEQLIELKSKPAEIGGWNDLWFEAHRLFVYETFLYIVASLLKTGAFGVLHKVFTSHYLLPETERYGDECFVGFGGFYAYSQTLDTVLGPKDRRWLSPAAELMKRQADQEDIPFSALIEADLLALLMAFIIPGTDWYPGTLHYASYGKAFPFFLRCTRQKDFMNLATVTGVKNVEVLRKTVADGQERLNVKTWNNFRCSFWSLMNMDRLDTLE